MDRSILFLGLLIMTSCNFENKKSELIKKKVIKHKVYTKLSSLENSYLGFNSQKAVNKIATIENDYFNAYHNNGYSNYYGTVWSESATQNLTKDSITIFNEYKSKVKAKKLDSMHCTIYAVKALKAGLDSNYVTLDKAHKRIWKDREYAGWSVAYILTKYFNWTAYLIISENSEEYTACINNFNNDKKYHVWKQPNIPIKQVLNFDKNKKEIENLLKLHEFGWGFSNQGWHTWITRFNTLKECNWSGAPSKKLSNYNTSPLFLKTKFTEYTDYDSHIIAFPPKNEN